VGVSLSSCVTSDGTRGNGSSCARGNSVWMLRNTTSLSGQVVEWAAQGGGGVTVLGDVQ